MKSGTAPVKYIVFDLGKVLIDYCYDDFFALLRSRGVQVAEVEDFLIQVRLHDYEHGYLSCDDFLAGMNRLLDHPLDQDQLLDAWNGLFTPIPEMLELAAKLKSHYPVYLLSNIGKLHWDYLLPRYQLTDLFHDALPSFEAAAMKPSAQIYQTAQRRFGLNPETTLFIDDKEENIVGARACGWHGIHHQCAQQTRNRISELTGFAG